MNAVLSLPRVRILDDVVVNQIAAGEVVERPFSVVKELVENSLDAEATEVSVAITNGGKTSIEILDNGWGMNREDAELAVRRFGTSKIRTAGDLERIASHGFRGEALPSIASVSRFTIETSDGSSPQGVVISIDGGSDPEVSAKPVQTGTRVSVRQLFHNVPARKKFLRSEATEEGLIRSLLVDFAVAYPQVFFRFSSDGVERQIYAPAVDFFARARELRVAGERPFQVNHRLQTAAGPVHVFAMLSHPIECVSQAGRLRLLVNRRSVRDKLLLKAIRDGYGAFLRPGKYPQGVLSLNLPSEDVDVNVHPQKSEVRFRRPEVIFKAIISGLKEALQASGAEAETLRSNDLVFERLVENARPGVGRSVEFSPADHAFAFSGPFSGTFPGQSNVLPLFGSNAPPYGESAAGESRRTVRHMRYVGQLLACYLVFEGKDQTAIMDMHAAHERVMFYRLKQQFVGGAVHTQQLLLPEVVELGPENCTAVERHSASLRKLGFELDRISETHMTLRMMPAAISGISARALLLDLFSEPDFSDWLNLLEERIDAVLARMACHRSIRSGRLLDAEEAYALVAELDEAELSGLCPHGRPTVKFLSRYELETMFGRA